MTNYTNVPGSFVPGLETTVSGGLGSFFGDPLIAGVIGILFMVLWGYAMKVDTELIVLGILTMILSLFRIILPEWTFWLLIIGVGVYGGITVSRTIHK